MVWHNSLTLLSCNSLQRLAKYVINIFTNIYIYIYILITKHIFQHSQCKSKKKYVYRCCDSKPNLKLSLNANFMNFLSWKSLVLNTFFLFVQSINWLLIGGRTNYSGFIAVGWAKYLGFCLYQYSWFIFFSLIIWGFQFGWIGSLIGPASCWR